MKVILTEKVKTLGNVGEIVNVSAGYARNYLIPNSFAVVADESNKKQQAHNEKMLANKIAAEKDAAKAVASKLEGLKLELIKKVGANGKLFGSVTTNELSLELAKSDLEVEKRTLSLETPIKTAGTFNVKAKFFSDVEANFTVEVKMDPKQAEEMKKKAEEAAAAKAAEAAKKAADAENAVEGEEKKELTEEEKLKEEANKILRSY